jgi:hypothetical protein
MRPNLTLFLICGREGRRRGEGEGVEREWQCNEELAYRAFLGKTSHTGRLWSKGLGAGRRGLMLSGFICKAGGEKGGNEGWE